MQSPSPSAQPNNPYTTPAVKKKHDFEVYEDSGDYDLSPPKLPAKKRRTFKDAVEAIKRDFKELQVDWESEGTKKVVVWYKKKDDGNIKLPQIYCQILLFLYSRKFKIDVSQAHRCTAVKAMMEAGTKNRIRKAITQVIALTGDNDLSSEESYRHHYIRTCLSLHRYFQQTGAVGFMTDMSSLTYYLRMQTFGSCFLQAACVAMCYLLQACGKQVPPSNASRLIRHHFTDEQLTQYVVADNGGDSLAIFKILEEQFFTCHISCREPTPILAANLMGKVHRDAAMYELDLAPALVSKFKVPENFHCLLPSRELKRKFPALAPYNEWRQVPAESIPPGVARFTKWNEPAEFIPFDSPSNAEEETSLIERWTALLVRDSANDDVDGLTAVTASMSMDSSYRAQTTPSAGEKSASGNAPKFINDFEDVEEWSHFFDCDANGEDYEEEEIDDVDDLEEDDEPGEGSEASPLHAMVLMGRWHRKVGESPYWLLQNSWEGPTQLIEVSTEYFAESAAFLYFFNRDHRTAKSENELNNTQRAFFCPSPVAESSGLERSDCEHWRDSLVQLEQEHVSDEESDVFSEI